MGKLRKWNIYIHSEWMTKKKERRRTICSIWSCYRCCCCCFHNLLYLYILEWNFVWMMRIFFILCVCVSFFFLILFSFHMEFILTHLLNSFAHFNWTQIELLLEYFIVCNFYSLDSDNKTTTTRFDWGKAANLFTVSLVPKPKFIWCGSFQWLGFACRRMQ